jgi:transketolase
MQILCSEIYEKNIEPLQALIYDAHMINLHDLQSQAKRIRNQLAEMSHEGKAPHLASSLSCVDLILAAYECFLRIDPDDARSPDRDRFILSKGHAVTTLYSILAHKKFFPGELLKTFNKNGSLLPEHPSPYGVPGVEMATGSLGHGLSVGAGQALAGKILKMSYRVMVLMSDGECNEGSVWEAALFAASRKLDSLIAIIDFNQWQATGRCDDIMKLTPLADKWTAFGWQTYEIDGNDMSQILDVFAKIPAKGKPTAIIAHTVKGKGISFMEDDNNWHYRIPDETELERVKLELGIS